ncbi:MAG: hypothetical protein AB4080_11265 [Trichodesmium sp.]
MLESYARELMNNLPGILPKLLYKHQAQRLVRTLKKALVKAILIINNYQIKRKKRVK